KQEARVFIHEYVHCINLSNCKMSAGRELSAGTDLTACSLKLGDLPCSAFLFMQILFFMLHRIPPGIMIHLLAAAFSGYVILFL
ncbi:hypothetical protein, partial [Hungatella hathewayi]|uniref:hypothetical protein n=2 Tax=Hungatella TaxID=1649459 RepID=UPI001A9A46DD